MRQSAEAFVFRYYTGNALLATEIGIPLILVAGLLIYPHSRFLATVLQASAIGILVWAALQVLRYGRSIRLYSEYLLVQGSITGRVRRIPYTYLRGLTQTQRGGIAIVYAVVEQPAQPVGDSAPSLTALSKVKETNTPPRQKLYISAKVSQVAALVAALNERFEPALPPEVVETLVTRRRLRDVLIVLLLILLTPMYVILLFQIF